MAEASSKTSIRGICCLQSTCTCAGSTVRGRVAPEVRAMTAEALSLPKVRVRGRSFLALIVAPEPPFAEWFAALDEQMRTAEAFFAERPVVADLSAVIDVIEDKRTALVVLDGLEARNLRLIGVEGIDPVLLAGTRWASLPTVLSGRE